DRHLRIYADAGREEARVGDVEPASAVHRAPAVDDRASGIAAHARRAHRVEPRRHERGGAEMTVAQHGGLARVVELTDARDGGIHALGPRREEDLRDERDAREEPTDVRGREAVRQQRLARAAEADDAPGT